MKPLHLLSCLLLMPPAAFAGSSTHYTLAPEALDHGGLRATSARYTLDGSVMPGGEGTSTNYSARTGYAGQLPEPPLPVGLLITATPLTIDEGGTRQLRADLSYDDGSLTPLPPGNIAWSVQSGPLAGISTSGLVTAAPVYQSTTAAPKGTYQTFSATMVLTVLDTLPDNFAAYAADGLPDDWQVLYFGLNNPQAAPLVDADGDGWDNRFEYNARLLPNDPLSVFSMSIRKTAGNSHTITFFPRFSGCSYVLQGSSDLISWAPVASTTSDTGTMRTILDLTGGTARRFYSINVRRQ